MVQMIFCVEDDDAIRELMMYTLQSAGFEARGFTGGDGFLKPCRRRNRSLSCWTLCCPGRMAYPF